MGYMHLNNLYKYRDVLLFKEVWAMEKVHGTSAHVAFNPIKLEKPMYFFSGGETHENFLKLFDEETLTAKFRELYNEKVTVYGEAYGGKQQGMKATYGDKLRFIAFDVKFGERWLDVETAERVCTALGIEFVPYVKIPATAEALDAERDADSTVAVRRGMGIGKKREGVVIRPLVEMTNAHGERVMAKHKRDDFSERATKSKDINPDKLIVLAEAQAIADEWVTAMRLEHVLDKLPQNIEMKDIPKIIEAMKADVYREAEGEIVESKEASTAIGKKTVELFKNKLKQGIK